MERRRRVRAEITDYSSAVQVRRRFHRPDDLVGAVVDASVTLSDSKDEAEVERQVQYAAVFAGRLIVCVPR